MRVALIVAVKFHGKVTAMSNDANDARIEQHADRPRRITLSGHRFGSVSYLELADRDIELLRQAVATLPPTPPGPRNSVPQRLTGGRRTLR